MQFLDALVRSVSEIVGATKKAIFKKVFRNELERQRALVNDVMTIVGDEAPAMFETIERHEDKIIDVILAVKALKDAVQKDPKAQAMVDRIAHRLNEVKQNYAEDRESDKDAKELANELNAARKNN